MHDVSSVIVRVVSMVGVVGWWCYLYDVLRFLSFEVFLTSSCSGSFVPPVLYDLL